jgi:hypothetical protein
MISRRKLRAKNTLKLGRGFKSFKTLHSLGKFYMTWNNNPMAIGYWSVKSVVLGKCRRAFVGGYNVIPRIEGKVELI